MAIRDVSSMVISSLCRAGRDDGLGPAPRGGMGERLLDALEGETRGNEASGAEPRQGGERAAEGGAPGERPLDALEGETRGNEASGAEPRQGGERAAEGGAPAIGPVDAQLAVV